jgi:hypothetical protein
MLNKNTINFINFKFEIFAFYNLLSNLYLIKENRLCQRHVLWTKLVISYTDAKMKFVFMTMFFP